MKQLTILLPENLDIDQLVNHYPELNLDKDYLKYLIYCILNKLSFQVNNKDGKEIDITHRYIGISTRKLLITRNISIILISCANLYLK
jgi:hypothetical protein